MDFNILHFLEGHSGSELKDYSVQKSRVSLLKPFLVVTDSLEPPECELPLLLEADVVAGDHDGLRDELPELVL